MSTNTVKSSRRTLVAATAWSVPAVMVATAAPRVAASGPPPVLQTHGHVNVSAGSNWKLTIDSSYVSSGSSTPGFFVGPTAAGGSITNATVTFWFPESDLVFTNTSQGSWGNLTATGGSQVLGGTTYYEYTATYAGSVTTIDGTTFLPNFLFTSATVSGAHPSSYYVEADATYSGTSLTTGLKGPLSFT